ncbi:hypothetical protein C6497_03720 [Candidatus Poribacteria bacterium]|nr:MAG: hypothetical protein C6497_03720 [Candidatus Poribacteria bacterium]
MSFMLDMEPGRTVSITEERESVLTYNYGESVLFPYFHPIYAPDGELVTDKIDGIEQDYKSGVCFSFGKVFDSNRNPLEFTKITDTIDQPPSNIEDVIEFTNSIIWESSELKLLQTTNITVYPLQDDVRIIDLSVEMSADSSDTLLFKNGLGLSYNAIEMDHKKVADSEGRIGEAEVNGKEADWATLGGITSDSAIGSAILPDNANGNAIFHSVDTYRGYLSAQYSSMTLNPDEVQSFDFRFLIYLGDLFTFDVQECYTQYKYMTKKN